MTVSSSPASRVTVRVPPPGTGCLSMFGGSMGSPGISTDPRTVGAGATGGGSVTSSPVRLSMRSHPRVTRGGHRRELHSIRSLRSSVKTNFDPHLCLCCRYPNRHRFLILGSVHGPRRCSGSPVALRRSVQRIPRWTQPREETSSGQRTDCIGDHLHGVLLLAHRGVDVLHPRGFLHVRGRRIATQEPHAHADEEHDAHPAGDHHLLLLRLVDLLRVSKWTRNHRGPGGSTACRRVERGDGCSHGRRGRSRERLGADQRCVLGGFPAVLLDCGFDRVGLGHRAHQVIGILDTRGRYRLGVLDHRRRLGLACRGLDGADPRLSRCLREWRDPRNRGRLRARDPRGAGPAYRQVLAGRDSAKHQSSQPVAGHHRPVPHLHGVLGLLRRLQHSDVGYPGGGRGVLLRDQHLPRDRRPSRRLRSTS